MPRFLPPETDSEYNIRYRRKKPRFQEVARNVPLKSGKWTAQEAKLYLEFVKEHKEAMDLYQQRRELKIFKKMSQFVKTRSSDQCRSHHQKIQKHHGAEIEGIIKYYQKKFQQKEADAQKVQEAVKNKIKEEKGPESEHTSIVRHFRIRQDSEVIYIDLPLNRIMTYD